MTERGSRRPSKSANKRAAEAVLALADRLIALSDDECARLVDDATLRAAIDDARRLAGSSAGRRQRLYVGKLMRAMDTTDIAAALARSDQITRAEAALFREAEAWRDELIGGGAEALARFADTCPQADTSRVAELCRLCDTESDTMRRKHAYRELFRELRQTLSRTAAR